MRESFFVEISRKKRKNIIFQAFLDFQKVIIISLCIKLKISETQKQNKKPLYFSR